MRPPTLPRPLLPLLALATLTLPLAGQVFINEVMLNPPTAGADLTKEYIELLGTPGRRLDGMALVVINGTADPLFPLGSIPPAPQYGPNIELVLSLDRVQLGLNGLLLLGIGPESGYPTLLPDTTFRRWSDLWTGEFEADLSPIQNVGSTTVLLVRNRPGLDQAIVEFSQDPDPPELLWGTDLPPDTDLITPVFDDVAGVDKDQYGDGLLDDGGDDGQGNTKPPLLGSGTPDDLSDDLEIVDEVSFGVGRGFEYTADTRLADVGGSSDGSLPERRVHSLATPMGLEPDALVRVDYRLRGPGWTPAPGATGQRGDGTNWVDTATEQWVRGEVTFGASGQGSGPPFHYFSVAPNGDPMAVQPFDTNVPLWMDDGTAPDFDFGSPSFQLMPGRAETLSRLFIPGDVNRDGVTDQADVDAVRASYGDPASAIFSNAFPGSLEGNATDPTTQSRPWDLDQTGNGLIDPSDLQVVLNFQGDTTGRILGVTYTGNQGSSSGIFYGMPIASTVAVTQEFDVLGDNTISNLVPGDIIEVTVFGRVSLGANTVPGQQNGIMQFVHDIEIKPAGKVRLVNLQTAGSFEPIRPELIERRGSLGPDDKPTGDGGLFNVNGYTTSFTVGLTDPEPLYTLSLLVTDVQTLPITMSISRPEDPSFRPLQEYIDPDDIPKPGMEPSPEEFKGVKLGHFGALGEVGDVDGPINLVYPAGLSMTTQANAEEICQTDLGFGGPGSATLAVCGGDLSAGNDSRALLFDVAPSTPVAFFVGPTLNPTPFKGGTLLVPPPSAVIVIMSDSAGDVKGDINGSGAFVVPGGLGPLVAYIQAVWQDPVNIPFPGWGLSNAVEVVFGS